MRADGFVCSCVDLHVRFCLFIDYRVSNRVSISLRCCSVCDLVNRRAYFCCQQHSSTLKFMVVLSFFGMPFAFTLLFFICVYSPSLIQHFTDLFPSLPILPQSFMLSLCSLPISLVSAFSRSQCYLHRFLLMSYVGFFPGIWETQKLFNLNIFVFG